MERQKDRETDIMERRILWTDRQYGQIDRHYGQTDSTNRQTV